MYASGAVFTETPLVADDLQELIPDDGVAQLRQHLAKHPNAGDLIVGIGSVCKIRWTLSATGKSGALA